MENDREQNAEIKAVIFDVDGTLVDSNDLHVEAWQRAFREYGKQVSREAIHEQIGKGGDQLMPEFCSREELDRFGEELEKYRGEMFVREYLPRVRCFPRVRELFERIKGDGLKTALASSAKEDEIAQHKKSLGIDRLVDGATSADYVDSSKPDPDIFQAALDGLKDIEPHEAIVVGDTPWDVIAARKTGVQTIGVLSGGFTVDELRDAGAVEIYKDIADLLENYDRSPLNRRRLAAACAEARTE
ncbi:MAG: HAD family hydrolase [Pyrinomonadaceae bacterium]